MKTKWHLDNSNGEVLLFWDVCWLHWDMMVFSNQINFGENSSSMQSGCKILDVHY